MTKNALAAALFGLFIIFFISTAGAEASRDTLNIEDLRADLSYGTLKNTIPSDMPVPVLVTDSAGNPVRDAIIMKGMDEAGKTDGDGYLAMIVEDGSFVNIYAKKDGYRSSATKTFIIMGTGMYGQDDFTGGLKSRYGTDFTGYPNTVKLSGSSIPVINALTTGRPDIKGSINLIFDTERSLLYPVIDMDKGLFIAINAVLIACMIALIGGSAWTSLAATMSVVKIVKLVAKYSQEPQNREEIAGCILTALTPRWLRKVKKLL